MARRALLLLLALPGCMPASQVVERAEDVRLQSPVAYAAAPPSRDYTYLCDDGRIVVARYHGTRTAELSWPGRTTTLDGFASPDRDDRSGRATTVGYARDDVAWHRHGAEAVLRSGAHSIGCRVTGHVAGVAALAIVPDAYRPGGGGRPGKL